MFNCRNCATHCVDFFDNCSRFSFNAVGLGFNIVTASQGVCGFGNATFERNNLLGAQSETRRRLGWEGKGFILTVSVKALRTAHNGCQRLNGHACHIVVGLLCSKGRACCLRVKTKHPAFGVFCPKTIAHNMSPQATCSAKF